MQKYRGEKEAETSSQPQAHNNNNQSGYYKRNELTGSEIGSKKQTTVRFEPATVHKIEQFTHSGLSFAEAVRRLTKKGLEKMRGAENER